MALAKLEFIYDYMGRRVKKTVLTYDTGAWVQDSFTTFSYDGWNMFKETLTPSGEPQSETKYYAWGIDLSGSLQGAGGVGGLIAVIDNTATPSPDLHFFTYDANGNVGQLVDSVSGSVDARYEYDAYGNEIVAVDTLATENPYRFSTKYLDPETALYYYGYRYYIPRLGRWVSRDPIEEKGGLNQYIFTENRPIILVDALGESPFGAGWGSTEPIPMTPDTGMDKSKRLPPKQMTLENLGIIVCNSYGKDSSCCNPETDTKKEDTYRKKALGICKDFVRMYEGVRIVVGVAFCLVEEEQKCGDLSNCNKRAKCRLWAHVKCYAKNGFIPVLGLPSGASSVGWNDLLGEILEGDL